MKNPLVSIIIPYYNGADYVRQAVTSAISQTYENLEVILIDDGSNDKNSIEVFESLEHPKLRKFQTINQGLSMARNTAISLAKGDLILPLDCDDMISNTYTEKAVVEFEKNENIGIVYSHACFFGLVDHYWSLPEFNKIEFLVNNCIFCASFFKRQDWLTVGGYKVDMKYGLEDYDFWLSLIELNREVVRLPDVHFFYRKHGESMISNINGEKMEYLYSRIIKRHKELYVDNMLGFIAKINSLNKEIRQLKLKL